MKERIKIQILSVILMTFTACGELESKSNNTLPPSSGGANGEQSATQNEDVTSAEDTDEMVVITGPEVLASTLVFTDTLFSDYKWYSYNMLNHRVYPLFDVYAIRSGSAGQYYKVQIIDYYSKTTQEAGHYELRVQRPDGVVKTVSVAAVGCGDPIGGVVPECDEKNTYVFLNLDTNQVTHMTAEVAITKADWDLGFKRTDVLLNSPSAGAGSTQGAFLYRNPDFFGAFGFAKYDLLMEAYVNGGEEQAFHDAGFVVP
ncbi:MAG: HmuY family protein [Bdellovibrionaceae bacterium]|nr:HmuY family protein [Pseudobdellovibrionaceae bacterium]